MSFLAEASLHIPSPPDAVFDRLADFSAWASFMPASFRPVAGPTTTLREGDRLKVRIAGGPVASSIRVTVASRPREVSWRGGVAGLLWAEHRFLLSPSGDGGTLARSVETWHGIGAMLLRPILGRAAEKIGRAQLAGLARSLAS